MKRSLIVAIVIVLCLPSMLVAMLELAIHWPRADKLTNHLPRIAHLVAQSIASRPMSSSSIALRDAHRAIALDPANGAAWSHLCGLEFENNDPSHQRILDCQHAMEIAPGFQYERSLAIDLENTGDHCAAEKLYKQTIAGSTGDLSNDLESMARSATSCGDFATALKGYEDAIPYHRKRLKVPYADAIDHTNHNHETSDQDDIEAQAIQIDEEYIAGIQDRLGNNKAATEACIAGEPAALLCSCKLEGNAVSCRYSHPKTH